MTEKTFNVPCKFIFDGDFIVKAKSHREAREFVEKHCGFVIGGNIHSTLPGEDIDWDYNIHPDKKIGPITRVKS